MKLESFVDNDLSMWFCEEKCDYKQNVSSHENILGKLLQIYDVNLLKTIKIILKDSVPLAKKIHIPSPLLRLVG
jgi:hypothetical protein